ncbi:CBS domain-containing protein [Nanoarchaeota archaeon]
MQIKELVKKDFVKLDKKATVSELLGKLKSKNERNVLIFDGANFLGIVSKRGLLRSKISKGMKIEKIIRRIGKIEEDADVLEAAYLMFNIDTNILPVERKGKIIGVLSIFDLLGQLKQYDEIKKMKLSEVKIEKVKGFKESTRIGKIINEMNTFNTYELPIVDGDKLVGLITISDIYNKFIVPIAREKGMKTNVANTRGFTPEADDISGLPVSSFGTLIDICSKDVDAKVTEAISEMRKRDIMAIVVKKNGKLAGLVTANNLLRLMASLEKTPDYNIKLTGLKRTNLEPFQVVNLKRILGNHSAILERMVKNNFVLEVGIKEYRKMGKKHKWSILMKLNFPGKMISSEETDWDIETAAHKSFNNLKKRVQGYFRGNSRGWKKDYE